MPTLYLYIDLDYHIGGDNLILLTLVQQYLPMSQDIGTILQHHTKLLACQGFRTLTSIQTSSRYHLQPYLCHHSRGMYGSCHLK